MFLHLIPFSQLMLAMLEMEKAEMLAVDPLEQLKVDLVLVEQYVYLSHWGCMLLRLGAKAELIHHDSHNTLSD